MLAGILIVAAVVAGVGMIVDSGCLWGAMASSQQQKTPNVSTACPNRVSVPVPASKCWAGESRR